jgi:hypothetical protein
MVAHAGNPRTDTGGWRLCLQRKTEEREEERVVYALKSPPFSSQYALDVILGLTFQVSCSYYFISLRIFHIEFFASLFNSWYLQSMECVGFFVCLNQIGMIV